MRKIYFLLIISLILIFFIWPASGPVSSQTSSANVDLSWTTDAYVPADYQGKALPSRGSLITVAATATNFGQSPERLIYKWSLDNEVLPQASGQGKQTFKFAASEWPGYQHRVKVGVENSTGTLSQQETILITIQNPEVHIYPLKGEKISLVNSDQDIAITAGESIQLAALPYYFNIKEIEELNFNWGFGGGEISQDASTNPNILNLNISKGSQTGVSQTLRLMIENRNNPSQRAETSTTIKINK